MRQWIVKPESQIRIFELTGLAKPGKPRGLMGICPGLAHQEAAGQVSGWVWNQTELFSQSKPGPLAGYPDLLLTLGVTPKNLNQICRLPVNYG